MGDDIVNSQRISFGKDSQIYSISDVESNYQYCYWLSEVSV